MSYAFLLLAEETGGGVVTLLPLEVEVAPESRMVAVSPLTISVAVTPTIVEVAAVPGLIDVEVAQTSTQVEKV